MSDTPIHLHAVDPSVLGGEHSIATGDAGDGGANTGPEAPPAKAELTDAGNARRLVAHYGADLRYVPAWGWMVWTGRAWRRDELRARELMLRVARGIHHEAAECADRGEQDQITRWARQSQQAQRIGAALWCAQPDLAADPEQFDSEPMLLPVANGTIDLRTGELQDHCREHGHTRLAPVYYSADADAPSWRAFLRRVLPDPEVRKFVQRLAGYSLTGSTAEQCLAFLYGKGRNGKSVFLETIGALLGDYHEATRIDTLSVGRGGNIPNDVAALSGARLVSVSETPEGARLNESLVKDLTGGDTISARFLRHEFFQFRPQFKLWIRGNHKPQIRGTDDGIWRRVLLVPFTVQIPEAEVDPTLPQKLRDELPGVLRWAVDGCLEWQRRGLQAPESVADAVREYRSEMDSLGEFLADTCVIHTNAKASARELYHAYKRWCEESGHQPVSTTRFGLALAERGFEKVKAGTVRWRGIGLAVEVGQLDSLDGCTSSSESCARDGTNAEKGSATVQLSGEAGPSDLSDLAASSSESCARDYPNAETRSAKVRPSGDDWQAMDRVPPRASAPSDYRDHLSKAVGNTGISPERLWAELDDEDRADFAAGNPPPVEALRVVVQRIEREEANHAN